MSEAAHGAQTRTQTARQAPAPRTPSTPAARQNDGARDSGALGNLATAQYLRGGVGSSASFPGPPLGNQDEIRARGVQAKCAACEQNARSGVQAKCATCSTASPEPDAIQPKCDTCKNDSLDSARPALSGASAPLPHHDRIQSAFGRHDLSHVRTITGGPAREANDEIGASAFTAGDRIGFRDEPDAWLAAHESAHVIQQREGRSVPEGGAGGDPWEHHADRVADAVVRGDSAEPLLDQVTEGELAATPALQKNGDKDEPKKDYSDETQEEFEQRVKDAASARLTANVKVLGKWAGYVQSMEGFQLKAQLLTTKVSEYADTARNLFHGGEKFETLVGTHDPGERAYWEEMLSAKPTYMGGIHAEESRLSSKAFGYWTSASIREQLQVLAGDVDESSLPESQFVGPELGYEYYADVLKASRPGGRLDRFKHACQWCHEMNLATELTSRRYGSKYPSMARPTDFKWSPKSDEFDSLLQMPQAKKDKRASAPSKEQIDALADYFRSAAGAPEEDKEDKASEDKKKEDKPANKFLPSTTVPEAVTVPPPRTSMCGKPKAATEGAPSPNLESWGPNSAIVAGVIARINAVLAPLGPRGYNVLPAGQFGALWSMSPDNMESVQSEIVGAINAKAQEYEGLRGQIQGGSVDYYTLCPIVDELLPSTNDSVREQARQDVTDNQVAETVLTAAELILVGLSFIFPPSAVVTVPTLMALGLVRAGLGYEQMREGEQQQAGSGAGIYSPDQEAEAESLTSRGKTNMVMGLLSVATSGLGLMGKGAAAAEEGGEALTLSTRGWKGVQTGAGTMFHHPDFPGVVWLEGNTLVVTDEAGNTIAHGTIIDGQLFMRTGPPPPAPSAGAMVPAGPSSMVPFGGAAEDIPWVTPGMTKAAPAAGSTMLDAEQPFQIIFGQEPSVPLLTTGEKPPIILRPWESPQEANELSALNQARPNNILLPAKTAGYDGILGGKFIITGTETQGSRIIVDIDIVHAEEATQIKELTGLSTKPLDKQVVSNVKTALGKSWKQWNGELEIKASPEPLPGQPDVHARVNVRRPRGITFVVTVPSNYSLEEMAAARQAALDYLAKSNRANALPPIQVVVQYTR